MINKRYRDLYEQYIHKGEPTPFTIGTLVVLALCFLLIIVATFTQIHFSYPFFSYVAGKGLIFTMKSVNYSPVTPIMIFIIYILLRSYSILFFAIYLLVGFFIWPIFAFGGGLDYVQNYFFGYILGFLAAILITGTMFQKDSSIKGRLLASLFGVLAIHLTGFIYCIILAILKLLNFGLILPILGVMTGSKIVYDIFFTFLIILLAPYIKNILWIAMKPKYKTKKQKTLENVAVREEIVGDNVN